MSAITAAVQAGGADPESNMRLAFAMRKAREVGVPDPMLERVLSMAAMSAPAPRLSLSSGAAAPLAAPVVAEVGGRRANGRDALTRARTKLDIFVPTCSMEGV